MEPNRGVKRLNETVNRVIAFTLISVGVLSVVFLFAFSDPMRQIYGLAAGAAVGLFAFLDLKNALVRASAMKPSKAKAYASVRYFLRFVILGIVFALIIKSPYTGIFGGMIGFLVIKTVIYATHLLGDRMYFAKLFKRGNIDGK